MSAYFMTTDSTVFHHIISRTMKLILRSDHAFLQTGSRRHYLGYRSGFICVIDTAIPPHLIERILFLEGLPNLQQLGHLQIGETPQEMLDCDMAFEMEQIPLLKEAIALCEQASDYVSRDLLEDLLEECEEAIDWLETQHSLIENVTLPNYLQAHIGSSGDD